jgi:hypothetical protein
MTNPLKRWHSSDIWKWQQQIQIFRIWGSYNGTYECCHPLEYSAVMVLYECEIWSLALREDYRLGVLRRMFEPRRDEVTGRWRKLHNEEIHYLYSSPSTIRMIDWRIIRWTGHVARMGRGGMHVRCRWGSQKERALGRPWRMWVDNIKLDRR